MPYLRILICGLALQLNALPAFANWIYTPGTGSAAFLSFNSGTSPAGTALCAVTNVDCAATVPINSAGAQLFTGTTPGIVAGGGTAGTPGTAVLAVQGVSGGTAVPVSGAVSQTSGPWTQNLTQINSVALLAGAGAVGTGSPRVAVGQDTTTLAGSALGLTTGSPLFITPGTGAVFGQGAPAVVANSWYAKISDGTNGPAAVKPASTAAATTDPSLVVQISPETPAVGVKAAAGAWASGAVASGAYASGAYAAGSLASGAGVDGWDLTQGTKADAVCTVPTSTTACSVVALLKGIANASSSPGTTFAQGGATAPTNAALSGMTYNSGGVSPTNGQSVSLQSDVNGNLKVVGTGIALTGVASSGLTGSAVLGLSSTNAPTATTGDVWPVSISPASGGIRIDLKDTAANTNPFAINVAQVNGATLSATNPLFTNLSQASAALTVTNPIFDRVVAGATGGASTAAEIAPNNTTAVVVKGTAGTLYGIQVYGINAAPAYLKIYNAATATCGSGTPVKRIMIPAASTAANGAGSNVTFGDVGVAFGTGITYCVTTGIGDTDTGAPTAANFLINVDYL
jgi:hypothetical protein